MRHLGQPPLRISAASALFRTPAVPAGAGPDFVNAVVRVAAPMPPEALLARLQEIERAFGRQREVRWGARTLDLDLLAMGEVVSPDRDGWAHWAGLPLAEWRAAVPPRLVLPHPRLVERGFVLVPWAEIAPNWRHPVTGASVVEMRDALPPAERAGIQRLEGAESLAFRGCQG